MSANNEVSVKIIRNLQDNSENRMAIVDPEGVEHTFKIGPHVHVQTDGRYLSFNVDIGYLTDEDERKRFIRALHGF